MQRDVDKIANVLLTMGNMAKRMPPSWDGAKISHVACGPDGDQFGKMLPGRGLYLDHDLKSLGITKPISNVYEKTPVSRLVDTFDIFNTQRGKVFDAERNAIKVLDILRVLSGRLIPASAITTYDGIIAARAGGEANDIVVVKASFTTVASTWSSLLRATGLPAAYAYVGIPGGEAPTRATLGAWSTGLFNPGSNLKYLLTLGLTSASTVNMFLLHDLLSAAGTISATSTSGQTITSAAIDRNYTPEYGATPGPGVMMIFEITTALGTGASNVTVTYTDQDGNGSASSGAQAMLVSGIVQRLTPVGFGPLMSLASGDFGVRSVQTVTMSAAMSAGVFALNLYYPLAFMPGIGANIYVERDSTTQIDGLLELAKNGSNVIGCLSMYILANTTTSGLSTFFFRTCAG